MINPVVSFSPLLQTSAFRSPLSCGRAGVKTTSFSHHGIHPLYPLNSQRFYNRSQSGRHVAMRVVEKAPGICLKTAWLLIAHGRQGCVIDRLVCAIHDCLNKEESAGDDPPVQEGQTSFVDRSAAGCQTGRGLP